MLIRYHQMVGEAPVCQLSSLNRHFNRYRYSECPPCGREGALSRRMIRVADVIHCVRSSLSRLSKHHMVPPDVCDAKQPVLGPSGGPEVDVTVAASPPRALLESLRVVL